MLPDEDIQFMEFNREIATIRDGIQDNKEMVDKFILNDQQADNNFNRE